MNVMVVKYVVSDKGKLLQPAEPNGWYAAARGSGDLNFRLRYNLKFEKI